MFDGSTPSRSDRGSQSQSESPAGAKGTISLPLVWTRGGPPWRAARSAAAPGFVYDRGKKYPDFGGGLAPSPVGINPP
jgi:hypothetical protein